MLKENFDIVHCHTPVGGALTRLVYKSIRNKVKTKCIYTAHGFHFYDGAPIVNWLFFYPIEKYLSKYTDVLITINKEDYERAKAKFNMKRIEYVPGVGVDLEKFDLKNFDRDAYRKQLGLKQDDIMLLSVGELIERKNHKLVIDAISEINDNRIQYYIVGSGVLFDELQKYINDNNLYNYVHLLGFRSDIAELNYAADIFVFPSKQEGLPVALMEAMASGLPCISSNIRGSNDLLGYDQNQLFDLNDANALYNLIYKYCNNEKLRIKVGTNNKRIIGKYKLDNILQLLRNIYEEI